MSYEYPFMRLLLCVVCVVSVGGSIGCTKPNPASCADGFCSDPALPFCDVDGSIGGVPDTCIAVECTPNEVTGCRDDRALTCNADGTSFDLVDCPFGCGDTGCLPCTSPDCEQHIIPKYLPTICDAVATTSLTITSDLAIDTSNDANCTAVVPQLTGPEICVIHHESITIAVNRTLRVTGDRAIALVADRTFDVLGVVDASAELTQSGPGGGIKLSGGGSSSVAGGGAGNRTRGGHGGTQNAIGGAQNGGAPEPNPATLTELFGGPKSAVAGAGGGGGAATLICCRCELSVAGTIDVNGAGGGGSFFSLQSTVFTAARGGGAGGTVVLQGLGVSVDGRVFSNGGSGGGDGGADVGGASGTAGEEGRQNTTCAPGGVSKASGGQGGCASPPGDGLAGGNKGGAGGGSAGFLLTYTPAGVNPSLTPFAVSPPFEPNGTIATN